MPFDTKAKEAESPHRPVITKLTVNVVTTAIILQVTDLAKVRFLLTIKLPILSISIADPVPGSIPNSNLSWF